jgi:hypothetical protein
VTIDRRRLVRAHNPVLTRAHPTAVLTVGNGDAALSVDISGLQTFVARHEIQPDPQRHVTDGLRGLPEHGARPFDVDDFEIPLRTQSTWGWYATEPAREFTWDETVTPYDTPRGTVLYADRMGLQRPTDPIDEEFHAGAWFHYNPRRLHLGRLTLLAPDGQTLDDPHVLGDPRAELDLWSGSVHAQYSLAGHEVLVQTVADPIAHRFAVRVQSALLAKGWRVAWVFDEQPDALAPFERAVRSETDWSQTSHAAWRARRRVENTTYTVDVVTTGALASRGVDAVAAGTDEPDLEVVVTLQPGEGRSCDPVASFPQVRDAAAGWWRQYWLSGGAVSFEGSDDPRAHELERRLVLSQYLMAVNCAGATPPAETGLTYNTWSGKFHLEMHWWHTAHFLLWGRGRLFERSLPWYHGALPAARGAARRQGYRGARWPKQTDPTARESPSNIGVFLVWQQPHLIYLLETLYVTSGSNGGDDGFLSEHYVLVEQTAEFMVDFVRELDGRYILPPPIIPAQESYLADRAGLKNPTFELAYWAWSLSVANRWRERLGFAPNEEWARVASGMAEPTMLDDGTYAGVATTPWLIRKDHPSMLMALGWVPDTGMIDRGAMAATLDSVWARWDLPSTWGWDYSVMAMTAASLGDVARALDALLFDSPKNVYLPNGHNPQMRGFLTLYLPANGGLLSAVAHIVDAVEQGATLPRGWEITAEGMPSLANLLRADEDRRPS